MSYKWNHIISRFWVWLLWPSMLLRFIHVVAYIGNLFPFYYWVIFCCVGYLIKYVDFCQKKKNPAGIFIRVMWTLQIRIGETECFHPSTWYSSASPVFLSFLSSEFCSSQHISLTFILLDLFLSILCFVVPS